MELENISNESTQEGPIKSGKIGIARNDTSPSLTSDKTIEEESKYSSHDHSDSNGNHSFLSHSRIYQSSSSRSIKAVWN